ncbi:hypothetical protein [Sphingomonas qomolangmaensis]|uniref:DUF2214 domain-containing protein n=1 Tax=Sphingomonas qomolangmaensis TaxID=2918765 RepID=A0ABY5LGZ4_9SPHN|nr:hypothetical protein [Sphingomonas qomolangmaensis]UUL84001.1 hypothetical protein NMP03_07390 [Sphingomonas qomolangmaensis]
MEASILSAALWLDAIGVGPWVRGSANIYPWANVAHVLGAIALVGTIGVVDLRLAGLWRSLPTEPLVRALTPVAVGGFAVMLASGLLLFASDGPALARSMTFQVKLALIAVAAANAAMFRWRAQRGHALGATRLLALVSLALWTAIVVAGRMIAYS